MKKASRKFIKNAEARAIPFTVVVMLIATAMTGMFLIGPLTAPPAKAVSTDFSYNKLITIDHTLCEGAHTNLVIWVHNISTDFANNCQADGDDIAFFSADNNTQYYHDMEVWNSGTGEIGAWVNISDEIENTTDFTFYCYYGDPDGTDQRDMDNTWDAKYSAVYHMNTSSIFVYDSSGYGHHAFDQNATGIGTITYHETGKMGYATYGNGSGTAWNASQTVELEVEAGEFTILQWISQNSTHGGGTTDRYSIAKGTTTASPGRNFLFNTWNNAFMDSPYLSTDDATGNTYVGGFTGETNDGAWHCMISTRVVNNMHLYVDKFQNTTAMGGCNGNISDYNRDLIIGGCVFPTLESSMEGFFDELWIIKGVSVNNSWVNTTFNNQNDSTFLSFGTQGEPPSDWGNWSDTWTISSGHTCSATGYEYGNWSFSEHINDSSLDEAWTEANTTHWHVGDNSSWWGGEYTYCVNTTGVNSSFTVLDNSGMNRSQGFGWVHLNDTDNGYLYPYIIIAYNGSVDFDVIMWDPFDGGHVWACNWNGTNMTDIATGNPVVYPPTDAVDIDNGAWEWADYLTLEGNYYKYIYNELAGTIKFKYWAGGAFNEPAYWASEFKHANLTHDTYRCQGIGFWNPYDRNAVMEWDLMNLWQLNYTTNASAWCNISDYNESRPHMDFPVFNVSDWTDEMLSYFNDSFDGNMSTDLVRSMMMDNITNPMNLESRLFEMSSPEANDQNDTIYYYSCLIDEWKNVSPEAEYDEWLHLHVQMCPEDEIDLGESGDIVVAIDVDNNRVWDSNDRIFWAYADGTYAITRLEYNGNGDSVPVTFGSSIWQSEPNAIGNLHRYNSHLNYVLNIPLASLIKTGGEPVNVSDVFGLSIMTSMSGGSTAMSLPAIWQNWNETSEAPFWDEDSNFAGAQVYFHNGSGESEAGEGLPSSTHIGRWGEGVITDAGGTYNESGDISYNMTIEASFNETTATADEDYVLVNTTIYVNNTGAGSLTGIHLNLSWWNCSCSDLKMTFVSSNQDISNFTWFNDSCYLVIRNTSIEPLTGGSSWHFWYIINVTNCSGANIATDYLNITGNATELDDDITVSGDDAPTFYWGTYATNWCVAFETNVTDVGAVGTSVFSILGILLIIGAIMMIVVVVKKFAPF